jgi:hypothetical protein
MREPREIKRAARIDVESPGLLIDSEGVETEVTVVDLSAGGCRVLTDGTPIIGEHVHLRVGRVSDYPAQVRWALGNEAGLQFTGPAEEID